MKADISCKGLLVLRAWHERKCPSKRWYLSLHINTHRNSYAREHIRFNKRHVNHNKHFNQEGKEHTLG